MLLLQCQATLMNSRIEVSQNIVAILGSETSSEFRLNRIRESLSLDKSSEENERNYIKMKNNKGEELVLTQIAGLIARRIVCEVKENDEIKQGSKFGIIRFGSRVDLYFENYKVLANINQKTISGETLLAKRV